MSFARPTAVRLVFLFLSVVQLVAAAAIGTMTIRDATFIGASVERYATGTRVGYGLACVRLPPQISDEVLGQLPTSPLRFPVTANFVYRAAAARPKSSAADGLLKDFGDDLWPGDQWRVVDLVGLRVGLHAVGHEPLGLGVDHAVFFRDEEPGGDVFPSGFRYRFLDAPDGDGSLDRGEQGMFFGGGVLGEGLRKGVVRQPDPAAVVGLEFGRLRVRGIAVENVGDGFVFVGGQRGDVDQCANTWVAGRADDAARVCMASQNYWAFGPIDNSLDRLHVVIERG